MTVAKKNGMFQTDACKFFKEEAILYPSKERFKKTLSEPCGGNDKMAFIDNLEHFVTYLTLSPLAVNFEDR